MTIRRKALFFLGFDVGGTNIKVAVLEHGRGIRAFREVCRPNPYPDEVLRTIADEVEKLAGLPSVSRSAIRGVGVGCAGLVDSRLGIVVESPNLPRWKRVKLATLIHSQIGVRAAVHNDADMFALAEWKHGAAQGKSNVVFITLGTGVGGALLLDGRLYHGNGFAGELGHATLQIDGPLCSCGNRGCVESLIGSKAIVRRARRYLARSGRSAKRGRYDRVDFDPEFIFRAARRGESWAVQTFEETGRILGVACAGLANVFCPDLIVVGGGVSRAGTLLFGPARKAMSLAAMGPPGVVAKVVPARLGKKAGAVGAALSVFEDER